jgi:hypothetical protein
MAYPIVAGLQVSTDWNGTTGTWYPLTDHNRAPIQIVPQRIETVQRMANGTMRKYVIAIKKIIDCSWTYIPSATQTVSSQSGQSFAAFKPTVDGNYGAGFMKAFYEQYAFTPIYLKITYAKDNVTGNSHTPSILTTPDIIQVFMTDFKYDIKNRLTLTDYVDLNIQFTEA